MTEANLPQTRGFPHWQNSIEEAASTGLIDYFQVDMPGGQIRQRWSGNKPVFNHLVSQNRQGWR